MSDSLKVLRTHLTDRFDSVVDPDTESCLSILDRLIKGCSVRPHSTKGA